MEDKKVLSIVTPTYNRAHLLGRTYESLLNQTNKNFEWIIVDDGSTDGTDALVKSFSPDFEMKYVVKDNGGKHTALNESHKHISGEYVTILDSDDYLLEYAVDEILRSWDSYEDNDEVGIVTLLKGEGEEKPACYAADEGVPVDIMRYKRVSVYASDCCEVIRTELFKKYPFPVFQGEKFISEGALWNRVSFTHKCVYINKVVYIADYQPDGLTGSGKKFRISNPHGGMYTANLNMHRKNYFKRRIKNGLLYTCYGCFAGMSPVAMAKDNDSKILMWLCLPFGWAMHIYWKKKYL